MRIIVVDDDAFVVRSLATILSAETNVDVVGTGTTGDQAVELYRALSPDVALLDIQMPGRDGLSAAEEILRGDPGARVMFLTTFSDDDYIVRALRSVMAGQSVLEGEVLARATRLSSHGATAADGRDEAALAALTQREREVVRAIADGMTNAEVAGALFMSEGTVRNHISSILAKLGLRNRTQIAVYYYRRCA